ncbi:hypothetical protein Y1Q_0021485 [Alligator mississippiensis]|uniref:Uncharacterized protein n=1 Tax=Alligator mississippiensis TaxID=8496 RepID=A0A151PA51_ALLMI|nr:hypothetical protein Y1Q_0021485 [Alligator mississippiensis]
MRLPLEVLRQPAEPPAGRLLLLNASKEKGSLQAQIQVPTAVTSNKWICTDVPSLCLAAQPHLHFADPAEPELPMLEHSPRGRVERNLEHEVESRQSLHNFKINIIVSRNSLDSAEAL